MARLTGVGVGPGDPELVTVAACRALRSADRVFAPTVAVDAVGRAESIVREAVPDVRVERLVFVMADRATERTGAVQAAADRIVAALDVGQDVAFATLGDPNLYSTFPLLASAVEDRRPATTVETVPGIMAFQALAARCGIVLTDGRQSLALVTALDGPPDLDAALARADQAVVVYKGGRHLPALAETLASAGRLDSAVVGELLGWPGERVGLVKELADGPASYLATVVVPPRQQGGQPRARR